MKKSVSGMLLIVASVLLPASVVAGQWELVYTNPGGAVITLNATDENHVFSFGTKPDPADPNNSQPTGYKMVSGEFTTFDPPTTQGNMFVPMRVACPLPDRCLMLATDINMGTMAMKYPFMLSQDGGDSWSLFPDPFFKRPIPPSDFAALGDGPMMFFGSDTIVMMSHDGGRNAKSWFVPTIGDKKYMSIKGGFILDENTGYLINGSITESQDQQGKKIQTVDAVGAILKTKDLALTDPKQMQWEALVDDQAFYPRKLQFFDENNGYMIAQVGDDYVLRKTVDGGRNWTDVAFPQVGELPAIKWVHDFYAFDKDNLIIVAGAPKGEDAEWGVIFHVTDGGAPVAVLPDPTEHNAAMFAITCVSRNLCWAGGMEAAIVKYTDTVPVEVESEDTATVADLGPIDRDAVGETTATDTTAYDGWVPTDLNGWKPPEKSSGCSASTSASAANGWFALILLVFGCAVMFGIRRSRS